MTTKIELQAQINELTKSQKFWMDRANDLEKQRAEQNETIKRASSLLAKNWVRLKNMAEDLDRELHGD